MIPKVLGSGVVSYSRGWRSLSNAYYQIASLIMHMDMWLSSELARFFGGSESFPS